MHVCLRTPPSLSHADSLGRWVGLGCWVICDHQSPRASVQDCDCAPAWSCHPLSYHPISYTNRSLVRVPELLSIRSCSETSNRTRSLHPCIPTPRRSRSRSTDGFYVLERAENVWRTYGARSPSPKPETRTKSKSRIGLCTQPSMPSPVQHTPHTAPDPLPPARSFLTTILIAAPSPSLQSLSLLPVRARRNPSTENPNPLPTEDGRACADWCPGCG
ncbi:hypothetical protein BDW22DRAFT_858697 [Trametopsis cervina]|nr:hypothetical protein BDW22DRAFT_858697 [Trametopsis cervina]